MLGYNKLTQRLALIGALSQLILCLQPATSHRIHRTQQQQLAGQQQAAAPRSLLTAGRQQHEHQHPSPQLDTHRPPEDGHEPASQDPASQLHLESMEDLEHVAHLSLRNFNLTDESLLHSSWLLGSLSSGLIHKQQQQADQSVAGLSFEETRLQLEQKLESFIWHLRNGHLRRPRLDELASQSTDLLLGQSTGAQGPPSNRSQWDSGRAQLDRCDYLVHGYSQELDRRRKLNAGEMGGQPVDRQRLMSLCSLATKCRTSDQLLQLIEGPWHSAASAAAAHSDKQLAGGRSKRHEDRERESSIVEGGADEPATSEGQRTRGSSLRESLSLGLAKLCPLILFQLHDDDGGLCSVRRDDRPPPLRVWGFASLFVTIVSFCSLIGLSITPLLGSASPPSGCSSSSEPSDDQRPMGRRSSVAAGQQQQRPQHHRASLTLFEGLAVGSLVGSALFSLIPQAFELQERESNQGFLLKALIIFFGIYLFFCSERLMRIILDTRQRRKKRKQLRLRSSLPSTTTAEQQHFMAGQLEYQLAPDQQAGEGRRLEESGANDATNGKFQQFYKWRAALNGSRKIGAAGRASRQPAMALHADDAKDRRPIYPQLGEISQSSRLSPSAGKSVNFEQQDDMAPTRPLDGPLDWPTAEGKRRSRRPKQRSAIKRASKERHKLSSLWRHLLRAKTSGRRGSEPRAEAIAPEPTRRRGHRTGGGGGGGRKRSSSSSCSADRWAPVSRSQLSSHTSSSAARRQRHPAGKQEVALHRPAGHLHHKRRHHMHHQQQAATIEQDISTVAWMIVIGDGLHNFIDGISIGAAFSESILSGVSISVAVICEEFPHELGDFAVLVSSGMTIRQALGYNFLSACTCYFGMAVGIILGDVNDGASYISALAAGVFLYIALVDMMGELSATLEETSRNSITKTLKLLLLQNIGIFIGISIIFILSFIDF